MPRQTSPAPPPGLRKGTVLPLFCLMAFALFGFVAIAIDLGLLAVARTECQNAADAAALAGARELNNRPDALSFSNRTVAQKVASETPLTNKLYSTNFGSGSVSEVSFGLYKYDEAAGQFISDFASTPPAGSSYTAARVVVTAKQPAYFSGVFGVGDLPTQARAVAVHRPRDIAMVLDVTGSMRFGSTVRARGNFLSADPNYPKFAHYARYSDYLANDANVSNTASASPAGRNNPFHVTAPYVRPDSGEVLAPNNWTVSTAGGPPCVRDFFYDPANLGNPATPVASPSAELVTVDSTTMPGAFDHNPRVSGDDIYNYSYTLGGPVPNTGNPSAYVAPTYNYSGWYGGKDVNNFKIYPTPNTFADQSDPQYLGDRSPRKGGVENDSAKLTADWDPYTADGAAVNLAEYLGWIKPVTSASKVASPDTTPLKSPSVVLGNAKEVSLTTLANFRDGTWEKYGYDLDVKNYIADRGTRDPRTAMPKGNGGDTVTVTDKKFKGYSMGPGYWGKTFFMWPPDPRWGKDPVEAVNTVITIPPSTPDPTRPDPAWNVKDTNGNWICDWRRRFFFNADGTPFDPQSDDQLDKTMLGDGKLNDNTGPTQAGPKGRVLLSLNTNKPASSNVSDGKVKINYPAVLKWLKSPPLALPPNLRAGRVVYYTSIPDTVDGNGRDQVFWKRYIDYVLNPQDCGENYYAYIYNRGTTYDGHGLNGYEKNGWPEGATASVSQVATSQRHALPLLPAVPDPKPYLNYLDNPDRPRSQMWFGPLTMMAFVAMYDSSLKNGTSGSPNNAWAGTIHESQTWQLKAGVNSVLNDIRNNHPNDAVGLAFFSTAGWNKPAIALGQEWGPLKDALFYPRSLVNSGDAATPTKEFVAYQVVNDGNGGVDIDGVTNADVPNGQGGTDPNTGMAMAFNLLTPCTKSGIRGPTALTKPYYTRTAPQPGRRGAAKIVVFETDGVPNNYSNSNVANSGGDTYYSIGGTVSNPTAADAKAKAYEVVDQIVKNQSAGGLSSDTSPARVYSVGFGDLFSTTGGANGDARDFLLQVQKHGGTSASGDSAIPDSQIITGAADERITKIRLCFERIFQSGVQVTLIE